jgi:TolA-binding protein
MTSADLHPEDLLDRVRRGQATGAERERVDAHLASCAACRFEQAVLAASMRDASPQPGDGARARSIEQAALAALEERGLLGASVAHKRRRRAGAWITAIAASSIATAAAAAVITHPPWLERLIPQLAAPNAAPKRSPTPRGKKPAMAVVVEHAQPQLLVPEPVVVERATRPSPRDASVRSAAEIFAAANEARRERTTRETVRLYRELERQHPRSDETKVARIALGRLLLDRAGDPRGALKQFEAYLADRAHHSLREEAMVGRALALGRLGRAREERAAWQALLQAFPASANAERARARVDELR